MRFSTDACERTAHETDYYPETGDSLYVEFKEGPGVETREVTDGLNVDLDAAGEVVGFDIDQASQRLDLSSWRPRRCPCAPSRQADR